MAFDGKGRLWVADRGNHRLEIFDQEGKYLESRYAYGRISGLFIRGDHGLRDRLRVGSVQPRRTGATACASARSTRIASPAFIPPFEREDRLYQGTAGEGVAVDADGNVYAAEGPNSLTQAGGAFTKYSVK